MDWPTLVILLCKRRAFESYTTFCFLYQAFFQKMKIILAKIRLLHRGAFCQFPFRWIYYYGSNESTGKETGKNAPLCDKSDNIWLDWIKFFEWDYWSLHRGAFYQFPVRWIHYCHSSKSTGKETGKMHLCALHWWKKLTSEVTKVEFHILFNQLFYEIHPIIDIR